MISLCFIAGLLNLYSIDILEQSSGVSAVADPDASLASPGIRQC